MVMPTRLCEQYTNNESIEVVKINKIEGTCYIVNKNIPIINRQVIFKIKDYLFWAIPTC